MKCSAALFSLTLCLLALSRVLALSSQVVSAEGKFEIARIKATRAKHTHIQPVIRSSAQNKTDYVLVPFVVNGNGKQLLAQHMKAGGTQAGMPTVNQHIQCFNSNDQTRQKLTIITSFARVSPELSACIIENRKLYALIEGVEACVYDSVLNDELSFSWQKWMAIKSVFTAEAEHGGPRSAVWWLDADAFIMNPKPSILNMAAQHSDRDAIFPADYADCGSQGAKTISGSDLCEDFGQTNAGVFILRNSEWTRNLMDTMFDNRKALAARSEASEDSPDSDRATLEQWWKLNLDSFNQHAVVVSLKLFDSMTEIYSDGDFVYHDAGAPVVTASSDVDDKWTHLEGKCSDSLVQIKERGNAVRDLDTGDNKKSRHN